MRSQKVLAMRRLALVTAVGVGLMLSSCTRVRPAPTPTPSSPTGATVTVPNVVGLSTRRAASILDGSGFAFRIEPLGGSSPTIVQQAPTPGTRALPGTLVVIQASCSPAPCPYPGDGKEIYDPCTWASR